SPRRNYDAICNDPNRRYREKLRIAKSLYQRGYDRRDIVELFRLIDWMMTLPATMEENLTTEIYNYEEERKMPYITNVERFALARGKRQKSREDILEVLQVRFESIPDELVEAINQIEDDSSLTNLLRQAITINSLDDFWASVRGLNIS
ncbi:MAG: transposase, partial [Kamptonema sp. SIO4C4]|nr:transposase [Kamptonema sp. SIO4C4]